jgi:K+-transporting ATPase KdpF subunit
MAVLARYQDCVKARKGDVWDTSAPGPRRPTMTLVIENLVAAVIGLALVVYLAYALVHPERF